MQDSFLQCSVQC
uniref:Uncharacterized protein n=1 Tax=Anguilla anguilla TaxID=7936 RepID=A0A0E9RL55_ANGAN